MESTPEKINPLLETYGTVVDRFFSREKPIDSPVFIFPGIESTSQADELPYKPDLIYFDPGETQVKAIQQWVENLRSILESEGREAHQTGSQKRKLDNIADKVRAVRGQAEGIQQLNFHLNAFRKALETGDESLLKGNPFYDLTKRIFKHNITGALVLFNHLQLELASNAPDRVEPLRSLREIFGGAEKTKNIGKKIKETIGSFFGASKIFLETFLFLISSFTTYRAVSALLQTPAMEEQFSHYFTPNQGALLQWMLATLAGILLTTAILDFKATLFRGMAEKGAVLSGIRTAFLAYPRWLVLALLLSAVSVKTNYDSISTIFSKKEYLIEQREQIHKKVTQALGSQETVDTTNPQSLHDLQAILKSVAADVSQKFAQIPEEELKGRDPRKGPRYWGKYFIVNGGFELGVNDVAHAFRNVRFARNMDQELQESGLPLDISLAKKLERLVNKQNTDLQRTVAVVQEHLLALDQLMRVGALSLHTVQRIFAFDHKQVNVHVQKISEALNANRAMFDTVVKEMDTFSEQYINLLAQLSKSSVAHFKPLRIKNNITSPKFTTLDKLQSEFIQAADQKSLLELTAFLSERYGVLRGKGFIALILFLSFAIDFLPLLLFSRKTARQGLADAQIFPELLTYLKDWEDAFVELAKSFFYRPAVQQVFRGLTFPNETGVRNAFFGLLEEIDADVKDVRDYRTMEQRWIWLRGLFIPTRTVNITGYNARVAAIELFLSQKNVCFPKLIQRLFPGIPYEKKFEKNLNEETFLQFYTKTETGQARDKERFSNELKRVGRDDLIVEEVAPTELGDTPGFLARIRHQLTKIMHRIKTSTPNQDSNDLNQWTAMVQQAGVNKPQLSSTTTSAKQGSSPDTRQGPLYLLLERAFMEPFPAFPYTRRNWLIEMSSVDEKSLEDLDTLHDFIPDFVKMLKKVLTNTLPVIQESLDPLEDICARFPEQCTAQGIVVTSELKDRFKEIEKESLGMWSACVSHLLGEEATLNTQFQKTDADGLAGVLAEGGDISRFYDRIHTLMNDAQESAQQAKAIEASAMASIQSSVGEIKALCDDVNKMLVKINILSLELRKKRPLPHAKLRGLNEGSTLLERAPREARSILETREKILARSSLFTDKNYSELLQLKSRAQALHGRVDNILNLVDK